MLPNYKIVLRMWFIIRSNSLTVRDISLILQKLLHPSMIYFPLINSGVSSLNLHEYGMADVSTTSIFFSIDIQSLVLSSFSYFNRNQVTCLIQLRISEILLKFFARTVVSLSVTFIQHFLVLIIHSIFSSYHHHRPAYCICCHSHIICCLLCIVVASSYYAPTYICVNCVAPFALVIPHLRNPKIRYDIGFSLGALIKINVCFVTPFLGCCRGKCHTYNCLHWLFCTRGTLKVQCDPGFNLDTCYINTCNFCYPFLPLLGVLSVVKASLRLLPLVIPYSGTPRYHMTLTLALLFYINTCQLCYPFLLHLLGCGQG